MAHSAHREGSLDSNIKDETPNDIEWLMNNYGSIKVIGFNGKKSEKMFYKYFAEKPEIKYVPLPSTSPANMAISFEDICVRWSELFV
jgi:hypoxanthine-DNA glycosylase